MGQLLREEGGRSRARGWFDWNHSKAWLRLSRTVVMIPNHGGPTGSVANR